MGPRYIVTRQNVGTDGNTYGVKFVYSEKATKFCEISTLLLSTVHTDKSKISQNFVAFSEYMNFMILKPRTYLCVLFVARSYDDTTEILTFFLYFNQLQHSWFVEREAESQ